MATRLLPNGSEFQVNVDNFSGNGLLGSQLSPDATALTDGRLAILYESDFFGSPTDSDPIARILGSTNYLDAYPFGNNQTQPAVAARADGGFGLVFADERKANGTTVDVANGPNITYVPISSTGVRGTALAIGDFDVG